MVGGKFSIPVALLFPGVSGIQDCRIVYAYL